MKKLTFTLILLALGALTIDVIAQKGSPTADTPVTTTIHNFDADTGAAYRIQSDSLGTYQNGLNSVVSIIQGIGDWELDGKSSTVRKVFFDFRDPVLDSGQTPNAPFQTAFVPTRFISKCTELGINMRNLVQNQIVNCPLAISISYGGATYAVRMNANYPGTELVQWTCLTQDSSGKCSGWQMEPSVMQANGERKIKGQLIKIASSRRQTDQLLGQFYFSFKVNVTNP